MRALSLRARLLAFFSALILIVQGTAISAVYVATGQSAVAQIERELGASARVFDELMDQRAEVLEQAARLVSGDFAFKTAFSLRHVPTMTSALRNLARRIGADAAYLATLEGSVMAGTLAGHNQDAAVDPGSGDYDNFPALIAAAAEAPGATASAIQFLDGRPYQVVAVPLLAPVPVAWTLLGFALNDGLAAELQGLTRTDVSIRRRTDEGWAVYASTLAPDLRAALTTTRGLGPTGTTSRRITMGGNDFIALISVLGSDSAGGSTLGVVLERPLAEALAPYAPLRFFLAALLAASLAVAVFVAGLITRGVTFPLRRLAEAAERIADGDYTIVVGVRHKDEIGSLAQSFNRMTQGLAERDRVRDLLGKVVSPEVARELIGGGVELGGEERTVTVLFTDIRGFTPMSESMAPQELVAVLNEYLTRMSDVLESSGGVVDKYIGDAIMAIFGAPLGQPDHCARGVAAALAMETALADLNREFARRNRPSLDIGVGLNTATVVAGNMGSSRRMNYTVIGDGVNVAARVEGLTRIYGVPAIVTATTREGAPGFVYRELDRVRVRGRGEPVRIHQPLGAAGTLPEETTARLDRWHEALAGYRAREWAAADAILAGLLRGEPQSRLYRLYRERLATFQRTSPGAAWDGTFEQPAR